MKSLLNGCAAVALLVGLAGQAHAEVQVREAPVYAVPAAGGDDDDAPAASFTAPVMVMAPAAPAPAAEPVAQPAPARTESPVIKVLTESKAPPLAALTPEETAFFAVLGKRVTDAASAYETYVRRAAAIDARFGDAAAVQKAVRIGAAYQPQQLQEGIVAYAALLALRNDAFVEGVKSQRDPAFADRLTASPASVLQVRGANDAAADVTGALRAQGAALTAAGKSITQAAYDVQGQAWSKDPVIDPRTVLSDAKGAAIQPRASTVSAKERLLDSLVPTAQAAPIPVSQTSSTAPDVARGLALAALAIMGRTGDGNEASFEALLHDATSADCLKMAKLNLNQCLAVAGPNYEDVYCTGRHAVGETASCVSAAANGSGLPLTPPALLVQRADAYGPEQAQAYGRPGLRPQDRDDDDTPAPAPQRYAAAPPAYVEPPQTYAPPARAPAPAPAPAPVYAQNDQAYSQAPYQDPRYAQPQPAPQQQQYAQQQYGQQAYSQQPYQQPYAPQQQQQQQAYPQQQQQYPYGYAAGGYYGQ